MRPLRTVLCLAAALWICLPGVALAGTIRLALHFAPISNAEPNVQVSQSGRYAFIQAAGGVDLGWLIDSATGQRRAVLDACPQNIYDLAPHATLGDGWLVVQCPGNSTSLELIAIAAGQAHVLQVSDRDCSESDMTCSFDAVGRRWMTISVSCPLEQHCESDNSPAENLITGAVYRQRRQRAV